LSEQKASEISERQTDRQTESQKQSISTGEMYSTICVEWATDHFGLCLT